MAKRTKKEKKVVKTDAERIKEIYALFQGHFGDVRFVGVEFHDKIGWIAKAQMGDSFENLSTDGNTSSDALKKLKNRIKKIIKRYNEV
jgi:hypothetical protein